jgi:Transcriptional regulators
MNYSDEKVKIAGEVVQSFMKISRTLTKFTQKNALSLGLTLQQMGILNTVYSSPDITLKKTSERLQCSKSTVSVNVDDLVNLGLIERQTSEDDRREIKLRVTSTGKELAKKSCQNALSYRAMLSALEKISEDDIQFLLNTHNQLLIHLQECVD